MLVEAADRSSSFLIFFYIAAAPEQSGQRALYAVDFGVKRVPGVSHVMNFDVIAQAYQAILDTLN